MNLFSGRKLVIATKHKKEKIIGPMAASRLGVLPLVPVELDTDQLGTFTGEIERQADPLTTARKKCEMALALTGYDLAIASEGTFGGHPLLSFIPVNQELVVLIDKKNDLQIVGKKLSTNTNFAGQLCTKEQELISFAEQAKFPEHGLILRDSKESVDLIFKGISDWSHLKDLFLSIVKVYGQAYVETDMRAMYNPTRMAVIAEATQDLLDKAVVACAKCHAPGFGTTDTIKGLPCQLCGRPTQTVKLLVQSCPKCGYTETKPNPHKVVEDPRYCDYCNP